MKFFSRLFESKRPPAAIDALGMISGQECDWFRNYAADTYTGAGAIVDLGCFIGATSISLAQGLRANRIAKAANIHAYDRFLWEDWMQDWWEAKGLPPPKLEAGSFLPEFLEQTSPWKDQIIVHPEDLALSRWDSGPIEFLLVDAMKSADMAESIARNFFGSLIPGKSYVAQQDFAHSWTSWIHVLQFRLRDSFAVAADIPKSGTVVFRYRRPFSPETVGDLSMSSLTEEEIEAAFDYSLGLVSDGKKPNIIAAKAMAYVHRGDVDRARKVVETNRWKGPSLGHELEAVAKLIGERTGNA
jgi:hypothetical protein